MNISLIDKYNTNSNLYKKVVEKNTKWLSIISFIRLLLFLSFAWFLYSAFAERFAGSAIIYSLCFLVLFLAGVFIADALQKKNKFLEKLILVNENEINVLNGIPSKLPGGSGPGNNKSFTTDLNLFGPHSLFQLVNRAGSQQGIQQLENNLANPLDIPDAILVRQDCVRELSGEMEFRQNLLAHTLMLKEGDSLAQLQSGFSEEFYSVAQKGIWSLLAIAWPVAGLGMVVHALVTDNYRYLLLFGICGLLIMSFVLKQINKIHAHISKRSYLYLQYGRIFQLIGLQPLRHPYLVGKQAEISKAAFAFRKLSGLAGVFDLRLSILSVFINGLFLSDLLFARAYMNWSRKYRKEAASWFTVMGEFELINSLATFHFNHPGYVFPVIRENELRIMADGMGHPMMKEGTAIQNNLSIGKEDRIHLITGSNMSGKSTFLRTLGLNLVLAQLGAPVFARSFHFRPMQILTSFHHIDSLEESTSYFYAELKCLQNIITALQSGIPSLVLLDEVMRGTNSTDKHDGTALLMEKMLTLRCLCLIATHDIELGILAEKHPGAISNYCFESELTDNGLRFDFTIRNGVAKSKNATYLMRQMGII